MSLADQSQQWYPTSVQVTVLQARGLRTKGKNGTNDAYAIMQVAKEKYSTSVAEKTVAPLWKEEATFDLPLAHQQGSSAERCTLQVHIMHRALVGPDKLLGQAVINLLELSEDKSRNKTEWCKLLNKAGKSDKERGEVLLDIQFMRNNMTASMFDLSGMDKPRSRLGKLKDKVRGKKKDQLSETASAIVPSSFTQVLTDSEEEGAGGGEGEGGADNKEKKKKHKLKSLFSPKSNLQKNMSQSMSVLGPLPERSSSLSGSRSSGLNIDPSEGKKKFKFMTHKRSGSSDSKTSQGSLSLLGRAKQGSEQPSNLCINGSHVYNEERQPRRSRGGSNFSLASSGLGSMEDLHRAESSNTSVASADSFRALKQQSPWPEEEDSTRAVHEEEQIEEEQLANSGTEVVEEEEKRMRVRDEEEKERIGKIEEKDTIQEQWEEGRLEEERVEEEKRRIEEQEGRERLRMEEERKQREEEEKRVREEEEERERIAEERRRIEEEETIRMEEERKQREEKRVREEEEERERIEKERRRIEEEETIRMEEERKRREEEKRVWEEEEERERIAEERRRIEEEETIRKAELERLRVEEERKRREEEEKIRVREERERVAEERKRIEEEETIRKAELERMRMEEERKQREEQERLWKEEEERERLAEERRTQEEQKMRMVEEQRRRRIEEDRLMKEEEERGRLAEESLRLKEQERRKFEEEEEIKREKERKRREENEESVGEEEEDSETISEEKRAAEKEKEMRSEEAVRFRKQEQESIRMEEERAEEERKRREEEEEEEERFRKEEEEIEREAEEERRREERERLMKEEELQIRREDEDRADRMRMEEDNKNYAEEDGVTKKEECRFKINKEEREREEDTIRREMETEALDEEACLMQENRLKREEEEGRMLTEQKDSFGEISGAVLAKDEEKSQRLEGESSGENQMLECQEAEGLREDQSRQMDRKERGEEDRIRVTDELHLGQHVEVAVESNAPSADLASTDPFDDLSSSNSFDETSSMSAGPPSNTAKVYAVKPSSSACLHQPQHFVPSNPFLQPFESETEPSQQMATDVLEKKRRAPLPPKKHQFPLEPAVSSTLKQSETKPSVLHPTSRPDSASVQSISADGKDIVRDKGLAPQPPGKNDAQKPLQREQEASIVCQMDAQKTNKIKTSIFFPKRLVQMIAPVSRPTSTTMDVQEGTSQNSIHNFKQPVHIASITGGSTVATHNKGPAPCRPQSSSEAFAEPRRAPSSTDANPKATSKSYKHSPVTDQVPVVFGSNPFEEDETESPLTRADEITASWNLENLDSYSHQKTPSIDQDMMCNTKKKSSKTEHAPLPPAKKTPILSNQLVMNQGTESVSNRHSVPGVVVPDNAVILPCAALSSSSHPKPLEISDTRGDDVSHIVAMSATSDQITQLSVSSLPSQAQVVVTKVTGEQASGKWDVPASASRRPHPVKPMSPQEPQPASVRQRTKDKKSTAILCDVEEKITMKEEPRPSGPYSQLTQEELISLVAKQQGQLSERDDKIGQMEKYIDALLVRVMEEQPSILMSMSMSSSV